MLQGEAEEARLVVLRHAGGGGGDGDALQADHFPHDATAGVGGGHEDGIQVEFVGGDDLEVAEQGVSAGVAAGEEISSQPSSVLKNGKAGPVAAKESPSVPVAPE